MRRKSHVRFGGGRLQKGSTTLHLGSLLPYRAEGDLPGCPQPCAAYRACLSRLGEHFSGADRGNLQRCNPPQCGGDHRRAQPPLGGPVAQSDDVAVTSQIVKAGKLLEIEVLDHLVIGRMRYVSLKERGLGFN